MKTKPSDFTNYPWNSVKQNAECEIIAQNIMKILKRTGNTFRDITVEEYELERRKDGDFSVMEIGIFHKVSKYCKSKDTAACFSSYWE